MYDGHPGEIDFGSSQREVRVIARVRVIGSQLSHVVLIHHSEGVEKSWDKPFVCTLNSSHTRYIGYLAPGGEGIALYGLYRYVPL